MNKTLARTLWVLLFIPLMAAFLWLQATAGNLLALIIVLPVAGALWVIGRMIRESWESQP